MTFKRSFGSWLTPVYLVFPVLFVFFCYQSGRAALHVCAERGHLEVAKELLEHKAYVNAKSKVNPHSLHSICSVHTIA